jgi:hypothetical protein
LLALRQRFCVCSASAGVYRVLRITVLRITNCIASKTLKKPA